MSRHTKPVTNADVATEPDARAWPRSGQTDNERAPKLVRKKDESQSIRRCETVAREHGNGAVAWANRIAYPLA